jgi:hypothetical protein
MLSLAPPDCWVDESDREKGTHRLTADHDRWASPETTEAVR